MNASIKLDNPIELVNITEINPLISKCQIKVCWVGDEPNRNRSVITKETALGLAQTLPGSPVVGFYDEIKGDFEEHSRQIEISNGEFKIKDITKPYGFVPTDAKVWFQKYLDFDEVEREYLVTEAYLWTGQYPECSRVIREGNNQSMELDPNLIDAEWTKDSNGNPQFFIINEAIISKLCILGNDCEPCFEGANITNVQFSLNDDFKEQLFSMMNKVEELLGEGGKKMAVENEVIEETTEITESEVEFSNVEEVVETEVTTEEEVTEEVENISEENLDETEESEVSENDNNTEDSNVEEVASYSLDEIPEYQELLSKYSELESNYNNLVEEIATLKSDNAELAEFKKVTERAQKMDMINNEFSMLDEADKIDVINKIDEYSLSDIKKELSVICFDRQVDFHKDAESAPAAVATFSLDTIGASNASVSNIPDWVSAVMDIQNENF